ncbi:Hypothetical predicted protein [Pelobates cultripes]|uniref:Uncharacterized protein n=1 Tax=Pelobates cultripes TaxID=61616 RepID=A0AAD1RYG6_PELCU|nr:Hypothetical predicted protein [Pelobates cultripes]
MDLIEYKYHRIMQHSKAFFYLHMNKGGKLLAQMLRGQQAPAQVHKIRTTTGCLTQFLEELADEFRKYYTKLYNIIPSKPGHKPSEIQETLKNPYRDPNRRQLHQLRRNSSKHPSQKLKYSQ